MCECTVSSPTCLRVALLRVESVAYWSCRCTGRVVVSGRGWRRKVWLPFFEQLFLRRLRSETLILQAWFLVCRIKWHFFLSRSSSSQELFHLRLKENTLSINYSPRVTLNSFGFVEALSQRKVLMNLSKPGKQKLRNYIKKIVTNSLDSLSPEEWVQCTSVYTKRS